MSQIHATKINTLIVSHNAGGAAVLAAWVKYHLDPDDCIFALAGPAQNIFEANLPAGYAPTQKALFTQAPACPADWEALNLDYFDQIITSTSAQDTQWETYFIRQAKHRHIPCYSLLDHWTNYQSRFLLEGDYVYPNEIWVSDAYGLAIARAIEGYPKVKQITPYYLQDLVLHIQNLRNKNSRRQGLHILFVSEPSTNPLYSELEVLKDFLQFVAEMPIKQISLRLRLHPRESVDKYTAIVARWRELLNIHISENALLQEDIAWSQWVVGCQTMAMVVAMGAGVRVSSCLPSCVEKSALPHKEIERLFPPLAGTQIARAS